jgi:hypothetical protein
MKLACRVSRVKLVDRSIHLEHTPLHEQCAAADRFCGIQTVLHDRDDDRLDYVLIQLQALARADCSFCR